MNWSWSVYNDKLNIACKVSEMSEYVKQPYNLTTDSHGGYRKNSSDGPSAEDKALTSFAEMMIERIETISKRLTKPWITEGSFRGIVKNLSGREYNGMNALMLLLHCENEGYKIPRFCTFDCVQRMNKPSEKQAKGERGELPRVSVNKGEKILPRDANDLTCIHKGNQGEDQV